VKGLTRATGSTKPGKEFLVKKDGLTCKLCTECSACSVGTCVTSPFIHHTANSALTKQTEQIGCISTDNVTVPSPLHCPPPPLLLAGNEQHGC
jgi:hypothetical protein